jgi:primosomal protein N' (replication factor Y) (superfamily II helicase)
MKAAKVVVDVPAMQTDRLFDYLIPKKWEDLIAPGMRVIVPFGPRKVQGFVMEVSETTEIEKLKELHTVLDLTPVLTKELLEVGNWLTEKTLSFKISALQVMLPAAMRAKYEKEIRLITKNSVEQLDPAIGKWFEIDDAVSWDQVEKSNELSVLQKGIQAGLLEVVYKVKDRASKKTVRHVEPILSKVELTNLLGG